MTGRARYRLRYFFDAGSGVCLWAGNDAARERWGYPIAAESLPLSGVVRRRVEQTIAWYDAGIDWDNPGGPSPWDSAELQRFLTAARILGATLQEELGPEFELTDESGPSDSD